MKIKNIMRRFISPLLLMLVLTLLTSCGVKPIKSTEEESAIIGTIGNFEVRYDELRYVVLNHKKDMTIQYGEDIWTDPAKAEQYAEELMTRVSDTIVSDYYAVRAMADFYYIGGGSAGMMQEEAILNAVQETVELTADECGSFRKYKKMLEEQYLTDYLFRFYNAAEECATELFYILSQDLGEIESSDEYIDDYMHSDKFIRTNHIFLEGLTDENLELAEKLHSQLKESDEKELEMIMLKGLHCSDYTMTTRHGKYFARYTSDYGNEYEEAAFELREDELSDIVESSDGYYIILRLPLEEDYLEENYDAFKDDIMGSEFNKMLNDYKSELKFEFNDYGRSINILEIE